MAEGGLSGGNDSFISFAFAVASVMLIVLYIPWIIRKVRGIYLYYYSYNATVRSMVVNPLHEMHESLVYIPNVVKSLCQEPQMLVAGAQVCLREKTFFLRCVLPKFFKFVIRPRIFLPLIWLLLLTSAMYATLTFDAHAILGLPRTATTVEIKKAYRSMTRRYHPDHNKTTEARDLFIQARRAYKALVDRDAFEEEEAKNFQDFSVGVALPNFLISRQHDGLVLFGLLGILVVGPFLIWYKFTNDKKVPRLVWHIRFDKERVEHFMQHFGIPVDPKFKEKQDSRALILKLLINLRIVPPHVRQDVVNAFPPLPDFIHRCLEIEKNQTMFQNLGLQEQHLTLLQTYMAANGVQILDEFEAAHPPYTGDLTNEFKMISPSAYKATRFLFMQHTVQVEQALVELQHEMGNNIMTSVKKLMNAHEEMYDSLDLLYSNYEKVNKPILQKLIAMPQLVSSLVDCIEPEIQVIYQRFYKQYIEQHSTKEQIRALKAQKSIQKNR
ncbi:translocation protein SEC63 [Strigomonas culicis]|uniref:Translocation protein SEC63 n=1 Tax=Strigomonas culicis TaxID=28005 RepID=S9U3T1_9TRYP|nr:translocation protein SEC63 [Strigomonas culicis]|eukprot:EPY23469.1 translocation protein SEC63 [Strigomonas culicis]